MKWTETILVCRWKKTFLVFTYQSKIFSLFFLRLFAFFFESTFNIHLILLLAIKESLIDLRIELIFSLMQHSIQDLLISS